MVHGLPLFLLNQLAGSVQRVLLVAVIKVIQHSLSGEPDKPVTNPFVHTGLHLKNSKR